MVGGSGLWGLLPLFRFIANPMTGGAGREAQAKASPEAIFVHGCKRWRLRRLGKW